MADLSLRQHYALSVVAALAVGYTPDDINDARGVVLGSLVKAAFTIADAMVACERLDSYTTDRRRDEPPAASVREVQENARRFAQRSGAVVTDAGAKALADSILQGYKDADTSETAVGKDK